MADSRQFTRRQFVSAAGASVAGLAAWSLLEACGASGTSGSGSRPVAMRIGLVGEANQTLVSRLSLEFQKNIESATNGQIQVQVLPASQLGTTQGIVDQTKAGALHMTECSFSFLAQYFPDAQALMLPYLFTDRAQYYKIVDGSIGTDFANVVRKNTGLRIAGYSDIGGFYQIANRKHAISKIEDMKGLRIKTTTGSINSDLITAMGGIPVVMDASEMFTSLQSGAIDGAALSLVSILAYKLAPVTPYVSLTSQQLNSTGVYLNDRWYSSLPQNLRDAIDSAMKAAVAVDRAGQAADDAASTAALKAAGATVNSLSSTELDRFRAAVKPMYSKSQAAFGADGKRWLVDMQNAG
jgi:TRAP-type transport system periplasmic protein